MVYSRVPEVMETGQERSKPLHNFTLPCSLKWGNRKHLRCMKLDDSSTSSHRHHHRQRRSLPSKLNNSASIITTRRQSKILEGGQNEDGEAAAEEEEEEEEEVEEEEEGIEAVREKIMMDLKTAADKMKDLILREEHASGEEKEREGSPGEEVRPWNLRTRRAACKAPIGGGGTSEERKVSSFSPMRTDKLKEKERPKFSVSLSKKEIDEDFLAMTGHRPPRRPKRRPKIVQKQMDTLFPGLWLSDVNADSYKVEFPENGKR